MEMTQIAHQIQMQQSLDQEEVFHVCLCVVMSQWHLMLSAVGKAIIRAARQSLHGDLWHLKLFMHWTERRLLVRAVLAWSGVAVDGKPLQVGIAAGEL
jgi:hypothetical protein